ncbi:hypothetical protein ACOSQ4_006575 [Xanthoceras sorbifolium]
MQFRRPNVRQETLDDLTKRIKVEVSDLDWVLLWKTTLIGFPSLRTERFVQLKLKGPVRAWWNSVEEQLWRTHQAPIVDWGEMKERLENKYLPINYDQLIYEYILQWKQGPKASIDQYTQWFHELSVRSKAVETETQSLAHYLNGLKNNIRRDILTSRVYSVEEAYQLALQLKRHTHGSHQRHYQPTKFASTRTTSTSNQKNVDETMKGAATREMRSKVKLVGEGPQCYKCKRFGHFDVVCSTRDKHVAYVCEKELLKRRLNQVVSIVSKRFKRLKN